MDKSAKKSFKKKYKNVIDIINSIKNVEDKGIYFVVDKEKDLYHTYKEIYNMALKVLYYLQKRGIKKGDNIIFQIGDNLTFIKVFWACILGGFIPVPMGVANSNDLKMKVIRTWDILDNAYIISDKNVYSRILNYSESIFECIFLNSKKKIFYVDDIKLTDENGIIEKVDEEETAWIQFSSGSTSNPKGVIVTHKNIISNLAALNYRINCSENDSFFSWMPLTHDMGLVACHFTAVSSHITQCLMNPIAFVRDPNMWFDKINKYKFTISMAPNFGFQYFLKKFNDDKIKNWDFSHMKFIYNGAEPISVNLCNEFLKVMSKYNIKKSVMLTVYGLAEATVGVAVPDIGEEYIYYNINRNKLSIGDKIEFVDETENNIKLVDVGYPLNDCNVRIYNENGDVLQELFVGIIYIKGENVTKGYYKYISSDLFNSEGWLNTGDLGFFYNKRLVVVGRCKDIIFSNGLNYYPHDLEMNVSNIDCVEYNKVAFSSFLDNTSDKEEILVFIIHKGLLEEFIDIEDKIRNLVYEEYGLIIKEVVPVKRFDKTSSGKIKRYSMVNRYIQDEYSEMICKKNDIKNNFKNLKEKKILLTKTEKKVSAICKEIIMVDDIDINSNLYEVGFNSIRGTVLMSRIHKEFNIVVPISKIFEFVKIKDLAKFIDNEMLVKFEPIEKVNEKEYYPASSAEKRIYLEYNKYENKLMYNIPSCWQIQGNFKYKKFIKCIETVVNRHEILRTSFHIIKGELFQKVEANLNLEISYVEIIKKDVKKEIEEFTKPFELNVLPLIRGKIIKIESKKYIFLHDIHHIVCDGTSLNIFIKDIIKLYKGETLDEMKIQYRDYSNWHNLIRKSSEFKSKEKYWLNMYKDEIEELSLPTDFKRKAKRKYIGDKIVFKLNSDFIKNLDEVVLKTKTTRFQILLAVYYVLLHKYSGQNDIIVGTAVSGRQHIDIENMIGMFVNTLALRNRINEEESFIEFLIRIKKTTGEAFDNQDYQFEELVSKIKVDRHVDRNVLFDTMFILQNFSMPDAILDNVEINNISINLHLAKFDITFEVYELDNSLDFKIEYCNDLFKKETIERMAEHYKKILFSILENIEIKINDISILLNTEKNKILDEFNDTDLNYDKEKSINQLFKEQVLKSPTNTALIDENQEVTYRELDRKADIIATYILEKNVKSKYIGIFIERSVEYIITIFGILKAGKAYVPIDKEYPGERINCIIENSKLDIILSDKNREDDKWSNIYNILQANKINQNLVNKFQNVKSNKKAYIIYTSGSTGKPKGVIGKHSAVVNLSNWYINYSNLTSKDKIAHNTSLAFDFSILDIFPYLFVGASIFIFKKEIQLNLSAMNKCFEKNQITITTLTTAVAEEFMKYDNKSLRILNLGGEKLNYFIKRNYRVINTYGPTENTVVTTACYIDEESEVYTIGKPISNDRVYILDKNKRLVPIGINGEIYIGGDGSTYGYVNNSLNKNKFIENPYVDNMKIYKTGDIGRWLSDGNILYVGRNDEQIKIRGYRIEIEEIEKEIKFLKEIKDVKVLPKYNDERVSGLICFIVTYGKIDIDKIISELSANLIEVMIPDEYIIIDKIPLNSNLKVDKKELYEIRNRKEKKLGKSNEQDEQIESEMEKKLLKVWKKVLNNEKINIYDDFFRVGGNSLLIMKVIDELEDEKIELKIQDFYNKKSIKELAKIIKKNL